MPERIERQLVVRAGGVGGVDDAEKQVHRRHDPEKDARTPRE
jgi:hypothetical protein